MVRAGVSAWSWRSFECYLESWHDDERRIWQRGEPETHTLTGRRCRGVERLTDRLNAPVQGTAADGLKLALALLWERRAECPEAVPVLVCHDEIVVECEADKAEEGKEWLVQAMKDDMDAVVNVKGPRILSRRRQAYLRRGAAREERGVESGSGTLPLLLLSPVAPMLGSSGLQRLASAGVLVYSDDPAVVMAQREDLEDLATKWHAANLL
jgi:hypothetical protein